MSSRVRVRVPLRKRTPVRDRRVLADARQKAPDTATIPTGGQLRRLTASPGIRYGQHGRIYGVHTPDSGSRLGNRRPEQAHQAEMGSVGAAIYSVC